MAFCLREQLCHQKSVARCSRGLWDSQQPLAAHDRLQGMREAWHREGVPRSVALFVPIPSLVRSCAHQRKSSRHSCRTLLSAPAFCAHSALGRHPKRLQRVKGRPTVLHNGEQRYAFCRKVASKLVSVKKEAIDVDKQPPPCTQQESRAPMTDTQCRALAPPRPRTVSAKHPTQVSEDSSLVVAFLLVTFSWLFRGFLVALFCLEKQCLGLFRGFFVLGKICSYSPWNSLLKVSENVRKTPPKKY